MSTLGFHTTYMPEGTHRRFDQVDSLLALKIGHRFSNVLN